MLSWEGYETIYLGNPSEAPSEIHLDGALTSYSRGENTPPPFSLATLSKIQKNVHLVEFENVKEKID